MNSYNYCLGEDECIASPDNYNMVLKSYKLNHYVTNSYDLLSTCCLPGLWQTLLHALFYLILKVILRGWYHSFHFTDMEIET